MSFKNLSASEAAQLRQDTADDAARTAARIS